MCIGRRVGWKRVRRRCKKSLDPRVPEFSGEWMEIYGWPEMPTQPERMCGGGEGFRQRELNESQVK